MAFPTTIQGINLKLNPYPSTTDYIYIPIRSKLIKSTLELPPYYTPLSQFH